MGPMEIAYSDADSERQHLELNVINLTSQIEAQRAIIEDLQSEANGRHNQDNHYNEFDVSVLYARFVVAQVLTTHLFTTLVFRYYALFH